MKPITNKAKTITPTIIPIIEISLISCLLYYRRDDITYLFTSILISHKVTLTAFNTSPVRIEQLMFSNQSNSMFCKPKTSSFKEPMQYVD